MPCVARPAAAARRAPPWPVASTPAAPPIAQGPDLWRRVALNGASPGLPETLAFRDPGQIVGEGPCNRSSAACSGPAPAPAFGPGGARATERACPALALQMGNFDALVRVERIGRQGARLRLTGPGIGLDCAAPLF